MQPVWLMEEEKDRKYVTVCAGVGADFQGFAIESFGVVSDMVLMMIQDSYQRDCLHQPHVEEKNIHHNPTGECEVCEICVEINHDA
mmetsp:Transcript_11454/g.18684  ORF Transcript_11454/g.18684 Transcript_11454/m.18684 type:complete len:86 (+) Transcript_11454:267-524(+)|eukprot:CAMPEP_0114418466 /NCGR_PEP_ID=MMETSP0103-20121206/3513_1 /TAXON_ID=37642 ORGANISM="Paraphysomonas imperforata, Strain PA2" /NCGR_SAMPLE_ID=MMETSP0103 /ASSEMBLY_ACC=CAM_ASM_000201 /LENGTH=85 /DNA_ID=CAMNT_0001586829 /DNA_START=241 /DNA_END=498 /DNA_ORIENTATION=-